MPSGNGPNHCYQIQDVIDAGQAKDLKQVAEWLNLSEVTIYLIMNTLMLAPNIQEDILLSDNQKLSSIPEYKVNEICREIYWQKQTGMWQKLLQDPTA